MKAALGVSSIVHDGPFYDALNTRLDDVPFYLARSREAKGRVLELCCGTGRLTIPLAGAGVDILGLDIEASMLDRGRAKAARAGLDVEFMEGDMCDFSLDRDFSLIFIPFNSLQNIYEIEQVEATLACVEKHLARNGRFVFDVFNPDINLMVERKGEAKERYRGLLDDGTEIVVRESCRYDAARQVNRVRWFYRWGDEEVEAQLDMRCYYPLELDALLRYNGWAIEHKWGDFDESPFASSSPKQICCCRRK